METTIVYSDIWMAIAAAVVSFSHPQKSGDNVSVPCGMQL